MQENDPAFGLGAKVRKDVKLPGQEGPFIRFDLPTAPGRTVHGAVVPDDSEAKRAGWDIMFAACSQECAESLKDALQKEAYIGELFGLPGPS
jgi:hypothetical protein